MNDNKKSQTVKSYISAIKTVLLDINVKIDEDRYLLNSLTRACKIHNDHLIQHLLIQKGMVRMLLRATDSYFRGKNQPYLILLYRTLFATMYFGLFRIGELTTGSHPVLVSDVYIGENKTKFLFLLRTLKMHNKGTKPQRVKITSAPIRCKYNVKKNEDSWSQLCPFLLLQSYMCIRPKYLNRSESFFVFRDTTHQ